MLLGSPPDMVRGFPLRETGSATVRGELNYKFIIYAPDKKIKRFFIFFKLKLLIFQDRAKRFPAVCRLSPVELKSTDLIKSAGTLTYISLPRRNAPAATAITWP